MIDIFSLKVEELASKIKAGEITSVEVCEKYIERINKFEKNIKAWVHFDKKVLLEKALEADEYRKSGKPTGPLHGVPIALKDIIGTVDIFRGIMPFLAIVIFAMFLMYMFPGIALWLPEILFAD